jgi:hypothetical protein
LNIFWGAKIKSKGAKPDGTLTIELINSLQLLNVKKVSFYTEREIVLATRDIENFLSRLSNENKLLCPLDVELMVNFLIGFTSVKLGNLLAAIKTVFFKIYSLFGIKASEILLKSIATRNLFFQYSTSIEQGEEIESYGIEVLQIN